MADARQWACVLIGPKMAVEIPDGPYISPPVSVAALVAAAAICYAYQLPFPKPTGAYRQHQRSEEQEIRYRHLALREGDEMAREPIGYEDLCIAGQNAGYFS